MMIFTKLNIMIQLSMQITQPLDGKDAVSQKWWWEKSACLMKMVIPLQLVPSLRLCSVMFSVYPCNHCPNPTHKIGEHI